MIDNVLWLAYFLCGYWALTYANLGLRAVTFGFVCLMFGYTIYGTSTAGTKMFFWLVFFAIFLPLNIDRFREQFISRRAISRWRERRPPNNLKQTPWWEQQLLQGSPEWQQLLSYPAPVLSHAEHAFLDEHVAALCELLAAGHDPLPYMNQHGFFGLAIPQRLGGLEFSSYAQSLALARTHAADPFVAEQLAHSMQFAFLVLEYESPAIQRHYLPPLAAGEAMACVYAGHVDLQIDTSAGSEATRLHWVAAGTHPARLMAANQPTFVLTEAESLVMGVNGKLNNDHARQYVIICANETLPTSVATEALGANFASPQNQQSHERYLEMRRALRSHCTHTALAMTAQIAAALAKSDQVAASQTSAELMDLGMLGARAYTAEAVTTFCNGAVDLGNMPTTSLSVALHAVKRTPVSEKFDASGTLLLSHQPLMKLTRAAQNGHLDELINDPERKRNRNDESDDCRRAMAKFDDAYTTAINHTISSSTRSMIGGLTRNFLSANPIMGPTAKYYRQLSGFTASFALLADIILHKHGSDENHIQSHRLLRIMGELFCSCAVLKRWEDTGQPPESLPLIDVAMQRSSAAIQVQLAEVLHNLPNRWGRVLLTRIIFPLGQWHRAPADSLCVKAGEALLHDTHAHTRFSKMLRGG